MIVIPNRAPSPVRNLLLLAWSTHSCPLALGFVLERETQPALMFHHRAKRDREGHDFQSCRKELFEFSASAAGVRSWDPLCLLVHPSAKLTTSHCPWAASTYSPRPSPTRSPRARWWSALPR